MDPENSDCETYIYMSAILNLYCPFKRKHIYQIYLKLFIIIYLNYLFVFAQCWTKILSKF